MGPAVSQTLREKSRTMTHLNEALRLADLGWAVFALGPTGKPYPNCKPCRETCHVAAQMIDCKCVLCHGCYAGTTDQSALTAMWEALPHSLIGIATGAASGVVVLDFDLHNEEKDGRKGFQQLKADGILTRTVSANTGGGGGHLYYAHPGQPTPNDNRGKLAAGVDVKGDGGFVIAPPSAKRGKMPYSWIPGLSPWDVPLATLPAVALAALTKDISTLQRPSQTRSDYDPTKLTENFSEALDLLRLTGVGGRNENLYRAACRGGELIAAGTLKLGEVQAALEAAATDAGMTRNDGIRATIRSGLNRGMADFLEDAS